MVRCYTLARVKPAMDENVFKAVRKLSEVKEVILTYGEYDLIIKIEANSIEELDQFIFNQLRGTEGIAATTTLIEASIPNFDKEE